MMSFEMSIQNLLMVYILVILVFIAANIVIFTKRTVDARKEAKIKAFWLQLFNQCLASGNYGIDGRIMGRLKSQNGLIGFYEAYHEIYVRDASVRKIIAANKQEILRECGRYGKSHLTMRAYFAYFCSALDMRVADEHDEYAQLMLSYLTDHSVFCRENALKALYSFGSADAVAEAFCVLSVAHIYHNVKLLSDGLIGFTGDPEALQALLFGHFSELDEPYQLAVVNYLRHTGNAKYDHPMLEIFRDKATGTDLKCTILRLIAMQDNGEIRSEICKILRDDNNDEWEVTAVAANAAAGLSGKAIEDALLVSLTSRFWYVRMNSAKSLAKRNIDHEKILAIMNGDDRFAREELVYELERMGE